MRQQCFCSFGNIDAFLVVHFAQQRQDWPRVGDADLGYSGVEDADGVDGIAKIFERLEGLADGFGGFVIARFQCRRDGYLEPAAVRHTFGREVVQTDGVGAS